MTSGTTAPWNSSAMRRARSCGAVGDEDGACALLDEVARGELAHFARADEEDGPALERAEDLAREIDGDRGDGDGVGADAVSVRRFFGGGKGALQQVLEWRRDGAGGARHGEGFLDLAENLRLADDHGVQAGGTRKRWRTASWSRYS